MRAGRASKEVGRTLTVVRSGVCGPSSGARARGKGNKTDMCVRRTALMSHLVGKLRESYFGNRETRFFFQTHIGYFDLSPGVLPIDCLRTFEVGECACNGDPHPCAQPPPVTLAASARRTRPDARATPARAARGV